MGLDITAYRGLTKVEGVEMEDGEPVDWQRYWHLRASDLEHTEKNHPGRSEGLEPGVYESADAIRFHAGSYGGYNAWRDELARRAGHGSARAIWESDTPPTGLFIELINFSDCEGVIGPVVAAKLAKDFAEFAPEAEKAGDDYWLDRYRDWRRAFEMAADNGAVDFH